MEGPAVQYNIGAAAYLGGDLPRAERAFLEVARTPAMAALAHYNLGLVALQRRDEREARDWFERTTQDSLRMSVWRRSRRSASRSCRRRAPRGVCSYYTRGGAGYDDNISLRSGSIESSATGDEDSYGELIFGGSYSFGDWRVDTAAVNAPVHDSMNSARPHFLWAARAASGWTIGTSSSVRTARSFRSAARSSSRTWRPERRRRGCFTNGSRLSAQLRATSVEGKGDFPGLTGDRTEFGLYYDMRLAVVELRRAYARQNSTTAKIRFSRRGGSNSARRRVTRCRRPGDSWRLPPCGVPHTRRNPRH